MRDNEQNVPSETITVKNIKVYTIRSAFGNGHVPKQAVEDGSHSKSARTYFQNKFRIKKRVGDVRHRVRIDNRDDYYAPEPEQIFVDGQLQRVGQHFVI